MNLAAYLSGCFAALKGERGWEAYFRKTHAAEPFTARDVKTSLWALILSVPCYYLCALAIQKERALRLGTEMGFPPPSFFFVLGAYALMFILTAYILSLVFDRMSHWPAWVSVRHWSVFFMAFFAAIIMGLNYVGILPFVIANYILLGIYLLTLFVDIRLAQVLAGFEWGAAVLAGCIITAMSLMVLLVGVANFTGV